MPAFIQPRFDDVAAMQSPAKYLFQHLLKPLSALADSTKKKLIETGVSLNLQYVESPKYEFGLTRSYDTVRVSTRALEIHWATSYLNGLFYTRVHDRGGFTKPVTIDFDNDPDLRCAAELFEWAFRNWRENGQSAWPEHLPKPKPRVTKASWEDFADKLTLYGIGFMQLHEVAHVYLKHLPNEPTSWSIEQENDADCQASEWYFNDCPISTDTIRMARVVGVASALLVRVLQGIATGDYGGVTHPAAWNRLFNVVTQIETHGDHPVFAFLSLLLALYRRAFGHRDDMPQFADFLTGFKSFIEKLATHG